MKGDIRISLTEFGLYIESCEISSTHTFIRIFQNIQLFRACIDHLLQSWAHNVKVLLLYKLHTRLNPVCLFFAFYLKHKIHSLIISEFCKMTIFPLQYGLHFLYWNNSKGWKDSRLID